MLVDPVRRQRADDPLLPPAVACISRRQSREVFQSSRTSWSSKIIDVGTVDSSQRTSGSLQDSWYSQVYSSKSATCVRRALVMSRRSPDPLRCAARSRPRTPDRRAAAAHPATVLGRRRPSAWRRRPARRRRTGRRCDRGGRWRSGRTRTRPHGRRASSVRIRAGAASSSAGGHTRRRPAARRTPWWCRARGPRPRPARSGARDRPGALRCPRISTLHGWSFPPRWSRRRHRRAAAAVRARVGHRMCTSRWGRTPRIGTAGRPPPFIVPGYGGVVSLSSHAHPTEIDRAVEDLLAVDATSPDAEVAAALVRTAGRLAGPDAIGGTAGRVEEKTSISDSSRMRTRRPRR